MTYTVQHFLSAFETLNDTITESDILEMVACFHLRNCVAHEDGSFGTIEISPEQFKDCLAYMYMRGVDSVPHNN